jgi:hypothetical protein
MRSRIALLSFLLVVVCACVLTISAQESAPKVLRWQDGTTWSDSAYINGLLYRSIRTDQIGLAVTYDQTDKHIEAQVIAVNKGADRLLLAPENCSLEISQPKALSLAPLDPNQVVKSLQSGGGGLFHQWVEHKARKDDPAGTAVRDMERDEMNKKIAHDVQATALRAQTLFPNDEQGGLIYFPKKKMTEGVLRIRIGAITYEFPMS